MKHETIVLGNFPATMKRPIVSGNLSKSTIDTKLDSWNTVSIMSMNSTLYQRWTISKEERAEMKEAGKRAAADRELFDKATDYDSLPEHIKAQFSRATFDRKELKRRG
jgi:hypothetical protein